MQIPATALCVSVYVCVCVCYMGALTWLRVEECVCVHVSVCVCVRMCVRVCYISRNSCGYECECDDQKQ